MRGGTSKNQIERVAKLVPSIWLWGPTSVGRIGNIISGLSYPYSRATALGKGTDWKSINKSTNIGFATQNGGGLQFGIKKNGSLWSWGGLGGGGSSSPVQIGSLTDWSFISESTFTPSLQHRLAVKTDGTLWAWGDNTFGQLGRGNVTSTASPVKIGTDTNWQSAAACGDFSFGIKTNGTLWAWGRNTYGKLGLGDTTNRSSPVQVGTLTNWNNLIVEVTNTSNEGRALAIKTDGTLWSWGRNSGGRLGIGNTTDRSSPVQVGTDTNWKTAHSSFLNTLAVKTDGTLWAWGANISGALGLGDSTARSSPVQVGALTDWESVATSTGTSSRGYSFAIKKDGTLWAWGYNAQGWLGYGNYSIKRIPTPFVASANNWSKIRMGSGSNSSGHALAIKTDGTLWSWGQNFRTPNVAVGQLGLGTSSTSGSTDRPSPVQIGTGTDWSEIAAADTSSFAIKTNGTLWAWGFNGTGQLGQGNTTSRSSPVQVGTLTNWAKVETSGTSVVAIKTDGTLWTWGANSQGMLGLGDVTNRSSPVQVGTLTDWSSVAIAASGHILAIKTDGTLWAWGTSGYGQLGRGNTTSFSSPVQVGTDTNWASVANPRFCSLAIKTDGTLWAWGRNNYFQLGLNDTTNRSSPVQVGSATNWAKAYGNPYALASSSHTPVVARRTDGTLWSWGSGVRYRAGLGRTIISGSTPSQIAIGPEWSAVSISTRATVAITTSNEILGWGYSPQNGISPPPIAFSSPIQVSSATNWTFVGPGKAMRRTLT